MCGGGVGSANKSSNDNEQGSGNSFSETIANIFTPGDGMSYVDGVLTDNRTAADPSRAEFYDYSPGGSSRGGPGYANIMVDGEQRKIRRDANDAYKKEYTSALFGALTGGIPGAVLGYAGREGIGSLFGGQEPDMSRGSVSTATRAAPTQSVRPAARPTPGRPAAVLDSNQSDPVPEEPIAGVPEPTVTLSMSEEAGQGGFQAIPNPDYDPTNPLSMRFISNPTYEQLLAYRNDQSAASSGVAFMAEGGAVGGNEKTEISDAVSAIKGEFSEVRAALAVGKFLELYGEMALRFLGESVPAGELEDTVNRFADGEAGKVRGPGDGSGVDDKVPASLEGQQDVLLADGEFVLRKKTADALEKKYGGGFLDAVNEAENNAPRTMQQYMARN